MSERTGIADRIDYRDPRAGPPREIPLWRYVPAAHGPGTPIVVVLHGMGRNADAYRDAWAPHAEQHGFVAVVPEFSAQHYPGTHAYNFGNMIAEDGRLRPRADWLFPVIDDIVERVRADLGIASDRYALYGHSAGGQLVHRLATFVWSPRIALAVTANAGSYTLPRFDVAYPFGLGGTAFDEADLAALFARPLAILLGKADNDPAHPHLPKQPEAQRQGPHRYARGRHYYDTAKQIAAERGLPFAWRVETVPGVAHSNPGMAPAAARLCAEALSGKR
jgi:poly(3-hydroxybutyrate) depolymerase